MVDPLADSMAQAPTLTELEEARAEAAACSRVTVEWMMASGDAPDIETLLAELVNRPAWHRQAACRAMGTDLFVVDQGAQYTNRARALCASCAVRDQCLETALEHSDTTAGMWGGTTPMERRRLHRGRAVA